ncbi:MAG: YlxM family DNA-binding protein [Bacillota bacterium]
MLSIDRVVKIGKLFEFYGSLLTDRQQEFIELYYYHDLSLGEIAEEQDISRQAVYDNLKRSEQALEEYEQQVELVKYYDNIQSQIDKLEKVTESLESKLTDEEDAKLQRVIAQLKAYQEGELE